MKEKFFIIRNILNTIFVIGAIVGVGVYFFKSNELGTYIILASMVFKMAECCFRFIK